MIQNEILIGILFDWLCLASLILLFFSFKMYWIWEKVVEWMIRTLMWTIDKFFSDQWYGSFLRAFTPNFDDNWHWRFQWEQLKQSTKDKLKSFTYIYGRHLPKGALQRPDTEAGVDEKTDSIKQPNSYWLNQSPWIS